MRQCISSTRVLLAERNAIGPTKGRGFMRSHCREQVLRRRLCSPCSGASGQSHSHAIIARLACDNAKLKIPGYRHVTFHIKTGPSAEWEAENLSAVSPVLSAQNSEPNFNYAHQLRRTRFTSFLSPSTKSSSFDRT